MLSWLRRRRKSAGRIEAKASDLVRGFGADAYSEARLRERHADGPAERKQWSAVALATAWVERNFWAEPALLKRCILRSRRRVG